MEVFYVSLFLSRNCRWIGAMCVSVRGRCDSRMREVIACFFPLYTWLAKNFSFIRKRSTIMEFWNRFFASDLQYVEICLRWGKSWRVYNILVISSEIKWTVRVFDISIPFCFVNTECEYFITEKDMYLNLRHPFLERINRTNFNVWALKFISILDFFSLKALFRWMNGCKSAFIFWLYDFKLFSSCLMKRGNLLVVKRNLFKYFSLSFAGKIVQKIWSPTLCANCYDRNSTEYLTCIKI